MTHELGQRELIIDLASGQYEINPIRHRINGVHIIGPVDYGWARDTQALGYSPAGEAPPALPYPPPDVMTWGGGPLAGSRIPGTRRLVFCGYSPAWQGFYVSSLGGAAYVMHRVGVDFVTIRGQAPADSILLLNHNAGQISVRLEPVNPDALWTGAADPDGNPLSGFHALQQTLFDRYRGEYDGDWVRVFCVGPAARQTMEGIIGSNQVRQGRLLPIEDWAGRGGLGSRLLQHHHLAGCVFGGDWEDPDLKDSQEIDGYFQKYYGASMIKVDLGAAEKYRYVPDFMTGGTFGVNMQTGDDKLFSFNYSSVHASDAQRLDQHRNFILGHYLKQFNQESIEPKNFAHCGEPCAVACKKYTQIYKKDYEPYLALGPQVGVFDQRAAEQLNHYVDSLGIDAIQLGGMLAWFMELVARGRIPAVDFGLPPAEQLRFSFSCGPADFDPVLDSAANANYAAPGGRHDAVRTAGRTVPQGDTRAAAAWLDQRYPGAQTDGRPSASAVFNSHAQSGCMVPNQYWVPGMLAPMAMLGKYFVYYGVDYLPPRELGRKCVERMVYELFSENSGVCRFHRKWVEAIVDEIIEAHYHFPLNYKQHQYARVQMIQALEFARSAHVGDRTHGGRSVAVSREMAAPRAAG